MRLKRGFTSIELPVARKRAFTLIELLVVIAIIAVLVVAAIVNLGEARAKSRDSRRISDLSSIKTAMDFYRADYKIYPPLENNNGTVGHSATSAANPSDSDSLAAWGRLSIRLKPYLAEIPTDPINNSSYLYSYSMFGSGVDSEGVFRACWGNYALMAVSENGSERNECITASNSLSDLIISFKVGAF